MALPSFYSPDLEMVCGLVSLPETEVRHAHTVKRLSLKDRVRVFNGLGMVGEGLIVDISKRTMVVQIDKHHQFDDLNYQLTMAVAIPKGDRQKVMVEMLTQLGVTHIQPLVCEFSATKPSATQFSEKLRTKWQRWAIEACKQSQNPWLPIIHNLSNLQSVLQFSETVVVSDQAGSQFKQDERSNSMMVIVGPEGGFSELEFELIDQSNALKRRFAEHILRSETAAVCAASNINLTLSKL